MSVCISEAVDGDGGGGGGRGREREREREREVYVTYSNVHKFMLAHPIPLTVVIGLYMFVAVDLMQALVTASQRLTCNVTTLSVC